MSTHIENEVVSMQFDNKHFESNVKTSLSTLEKLKQSLKLHDAAKGFENVSAAAKKINLNPLSRACDTVGLRFNALYTMADQAMRNITNSVQRTATNMAKAFTTDPIKTGFQEYETQINAVQTILANTQSKGTTLDDVNAALDTLNTYADKTIYNFTEMTRNIGTFTAAGVDLDTSVNAIQGIANLAAVSGSNAQQASTAMYQLSQALASGTVKLMDWNSVVIAGMGGQVFQDALKETARVHGVAIDDMIKKEGSFRDTLKKGWLTSEILTETLQKFTLTTEGLTEAQIEQNRQMLKSKGYTDDQIDKIFELGQTATDAATKVKTFTQLMDTLKEAAQSGWTQTWEILIGDFEEAKNLWTGVSEIFNKFIETTSKNRNDLLTGALDNSGWDKFIAKADEAGIKVKDFEEAVKEAAKKHDVDIDSIIKDYGSLEKAVQAGKISVDILKEALNNVFGKKGQKKFEEYTVKAGDTLSELAKKWNTSVEEIAFLNKIDNPDLIITGQILKIPKAIEDTGKAADKADDELESLAEALEHVKDKGGKELLHESIANAWQGLTTILKEVGKAWRDAFPPMQSDQLFKIVEGIHKFSQHLRVGEETADKLGRTFKGVFAILDIITTLIGGGFKLAFKTLTAVLGKFNLHILDVTAGIGDAFANLRDNLDKVIGIIADWLVAIYKIPQVQSVLTKIKNTFKDTFGWLVDLFDKVKSAFKKEPLEIDADGLQILSKPIAKNLEKFEDVFTEFKGGTETIKSFKIAASDMANVVSGELKDSGVDLDTIKGKITGFFEAIKEFLGDKGGSLLSLAALVGFGLGFKKVFDIVSSSVTAFTDVVKSFAKGILGISESVSKFFNTLGETVTKVGNSLSWKFKAEAFKAIAISVAILVASLIALSYVLKDSENQLLPALGVLAGVGAVLAGLAVVLTKFVDEKDLKQLSALILSLGASLVLIAYAAKILGGMHENEFNQGILAILGMVGAIAILTAISKFAGKDMWSLGQMLVKIGGSLLLMSLAIGIFGKMDADTLSQGIVAVTILLGEIALMMWATKLLAKNNPRAIEKVGSMMTSFGVALLLMTTSIKILGSMDTATLIQGIAAVSTILIEMGALMAATKLLVKVDKGQSFVKIGGIMASLGAALLLISAAVAILGNMKMETLIQGGIAVTAFMGIMLVVMSMSKKLVTVGGTAAKAGLIMLEFAGAMVLLSGVMLILGLIPTERLLKATVAIGAMGLMFAVMIKATAGSQKQIGTVVALAAAVGVLAIALSALTLIDDADLLKTSVALGGVMAMMAVLVASTKFISLKSAASVALMGLVVAGLAYIIKKLTDIDAKEALVASGAISLLIASLSASLLLVSKATRGGAIKYGGIVKMALALAAIGVVAGILIGVGVAFLPTIGEKIASFLNTITPALTGLTNIDSSILSSIGTLLEAMGTLASGAADFAVADFFTRGKASESFKTFTSWINGVLPIIKEFGIGLTGVEINTENLKAVVGAVRDLAEAASLAPTMTAGAFASKWAAGAVISIPMLTEAKNWIVQVAPIVKQLAIDVSGISVNKDNLELVCKAAEDLAKAAELAPSAYVGGAGFTSKWGTGGGGVISWHLLEEAKNWIVGVAPVVQSLAESVTSGSAKELNKANLEAVCDGARILAEAASLAPSNELMAGLAWGPWGGAVGVGVSWTLLDEVASWISAIKQPLIDLATEVSDSKIPEFNGDNLTSVVTAVKTLCEAAKEAPTVDMDVGAGGIAGLAWFAGLGISHPMITAMADFIDGISGPMQLLAGAVANANIEEVDVAAMEAILGGVAKIANAKFPTLDAGGGIAGSLVGGFSLGIAGGVSIPQITEIATFIDSVREPIELLSKAISSANIEEVDVDAMEAIFSGIADIANANFPAMDIGGGIAGSLVGGFSLGIAGGASIPQITEIADFITNVKQPIMDLASAVETGLDTEFSVDNFEAITKAIVDIASAEFPAEVGGGGLAAFPLIGAIAAGGGYSSPKITEIADFLKDVKDPIIALANTVSDGLSTEFNKENFESIAKAIVDISSATFPTSTTANVGVATVFDILTAEASYISGADISGVKQFIIDVKDPIIELAKAVSDGIPTAFNKDNFSAVMGAVADLASATFPTNTSTNFTSFLGRIMGFEFTDEQKTDFDGFIDFIKKVREPITTLATEVSKDDVVIDHKKISSITTAVTDIANSTKDIPTIGGLNGFLEGQTDFTGFVTFLGSLAPNLTALNTSLADASIDPVKIGAATSAIKNLAQAASYIPEDGKFWQFWKNDTDWDAFNTNVPKMGSAISGFCSNLGDINVETTRIGAQAVQRIADALFTMSAMPFSTLGEDVAEFSTHTSSLVTIVKNFSDGVTGINTEAVNSASGLISTAIKTLQKLTEFDISTANTEMFDVKLDELATAVSEFSSNVDGVDPSGAIGKINDLVDMLTTIKATDFAGASSFKTALTDVASTSISDFVGQFNSETTAASARQGGDYLMSAVILGIKNKIEAVTNASDEAADAGPTAILTPENYQSWHDAGSYVGSGFVAGINSKLTDATNAGTALGKAALEAAKAALDENSPSKEFYKVGEFAGIGLIDALYEYERNTYKAGYGVGESAKFGLSDAISKVKNLIENGMDDQPMIRPVLDLSEISAGADGINRMFNMRPTVGVVGNLGNISAMMEKGQNGGNDDVIAAINGLGSKISESGRDTYNINGITYDDGSNITETVKSLIRAVLVEGRV